MKEIIIGLAYNVPNAFTSTSRPKNKPRKLHRNSAQMCSVDLTTWALHSSGESSRSIVNIDIGPTHKNVVYYIRFDNI